MSQSSENTHTPWLAGVCGLFPGGGQIYNRHYPKAVLLYLYAILMFFFFLFGPRIGGGGFFGEGQEQFFMFSYSMIEHEENDFLLFIRFVAFFSIPLVYLFSIIEAVLTARRLNRGANTFGAVSGGTIMSTNKPSASNQDSLRTEANAIMGDPVSSGTDTGANSSEAGTQAPPSPPPKTERHERGNARLVFGLLMLGFGSLFLLTDLFPRFSIVDLWPAVPLLIGVLILNDYRIHKDSGRLVLGSIFLGIGVLFGLNEWTWFEPFQFIEWGLESVFDYWYLILIAFGGLLVLQELSGGHRRRKSHHKE